MNWPQMVIMFFEQALSDSDAFGRANTLPLMNCWSIQCVAAPCVKIYRYDFAGTVLIAAAKFRSPDWFCGPAISAAPLPIIMGTLACLPARNTLSDVSERTHLSM